MTTSLAGRRILFEGSVQPWDVGWTFIQMLGLALARQNEVLYVDAPLSVARIRRSTLRRLRPFAERGPTAGLTLFRSATIPAQRTELLWRAASSLTGRRVARWARRNDFVPDLIWAFTPWALEHIARFPRARVVYWTGDHESLLPREDELYRRADAVLCVALPVASRLGEEYGDKVHFVPVAVDFERFDAARRAAGRGTLLDGLHRPIAGYAGSVNRRLDVPLLVELARNFEGTVVLAGPERLAPSQRAALEAESNIVRLGPQTAERVAPLMLEFDVALIPYVEDEFNLNCNPVKFYEYLALGLPVVSTDVPTLAEFDGPASIGSRDTFVARTLAMLERKDADIDLRVEIARVHSFDALLDRLDRVVPA